jgi:hypothetical protein
MLFFLLMHVMVGLRLSNLASNSEKKDDGEVNRV